MPLLLATAAGGRGGAAATHGSKGSEGPKGSVPRRVRAVVALGMLGDRRATPVLVACLDERTDGWVRVAAAYALGDLGDPAAAPALCRVLSYAGDLHRPRDNWAYPGVGNTDVPPEAWPEAEYYAVDVGAADALLRLGVAGAAGWLLEERLAPRTGRWRIRVLQDACDAIRRAFPDAPRGFEPDAGLPERQRAWSELIAWWRSGPRLPDGRALDETDAGYREAARHVVEALVGRRVLEIQTGTKVAALLGPALTPSLVEALATADSKFARIQVASALGIVRDPRAVAPLLRLTRDEVPQVRANAVEALGPHLRPRGSPPEGAAEVLARCLEMLDDPEEGPRTSAMKALVAAPVSPAVAKVLAARRAAARPEDAASDYALAAEVADLVQTGEGLETVATRLTDPVLFRRRTAWELLRNALDLDPELFDPAPDPGTAAAKPADLAAIRAALAKRRGP